MSVALVKELRERTGLGMMECKKALTAADNDVEKAIEELRKSSGIKAAKKAGRTAADGVVAVKVADDASYGVMLEINSETDFVARDDGFLGFVGSVVGAAYDNKQTDVSVLMEGELESKRPSASYAIARFGTRTAKSSRETAPNFGVINPCGHLK